MEYDVPTIVAAIVQHDVDAVLKSLEAGVAANAAAADGQSLLEIALASGYVPIVAALLSAGADIHHAGYCNISIIDNVMLEACHEADPAGLDLLLQAGMSPDAFDLDVEQGVTLLMHASFTNLGVVSLLISRGAAINARDSRGWSPLMYACSANEAACSYRESVQIVQYLLEHGANPTFKSDKGWSAYDIAQQTYDAEARQEILTCLKCARL